MRFFPKRLPRKLAMTQAQTAAQIERGHHAKLVMTLLN